MEAKEKLLQRHPPQIKCEKLSHVASPQHKLLLCPWNAKAFSFSVLLQSSSTKQNWKKKISRWTETAQILGNSAWR